MAAASFYSFLMKYNHVSTNPKSLIWWGSTGQVYLSGETGEVRQLQEVGVTLNTGLRVGVDGWEPGLGDVRGVWLSAKREEDASAVNVNGKIMICQRRDKPSPSNRAGSRSSPDNISLENLPNPTVRQSIFDKTEHWVCKNLAIFTYCKNFSHLWHPHLHSV